MKAGAVTVHAIEVFNHRIGSRKITEAIWALVVKPFPHKFAVFFTINSDTPGSGRALRLNSWRNMLMSLFATSDLARLVAERS